MLLRLYHAPTTGPRVPSARVHRIASDTPTFGRVPHVCDRLLLIVMYVCLHRVDIPATWTAVAFYAGCITLLCEGVHLLTSHPSIDAEDLIETVHLEILLPAFTIGCIVKHPHGPHHEKPVLANDGAPAAAAAAAQPPPIERMSTFARIRAVPQERVKFFVSAVFMVLVGLSMPSLFNADTISSGGGHRRALAALLADADDLNNGTTMGGNATDAGGDGSGSHGSGGSAQPAMPAGTLVLHVLVCSLLMNVGKMFPSFCYRSEVNYSTRLALAIGMMPRGEVCAGIIVSAIALDVRVQRTWGSPDEPAPPLSLAKTLPSLSYAVADAAHSRARMFESPTLVRRRTA